MFSVVGNYRDDVAEVVLEPVAEAAHVVCVDLDGCPALEHRQRVAPEGDVLGVAPPGPVRVHYVRVVAHLLQNPRGQRDAVDDRSEQPTSIKSTNSNQCIMST
jgi:hypothetical protein